MLLFLLVKYKLHNGLDLILIQLHTFLYDKYLPSRVIIFVGRDSFRI